MENFIKIAALVLLLPVLVLVVINFLTTRTIKTEVTINASPEKVWSVLMKHEAYPDWNPFIKQISGSTKVGESLEVTIQSNENEPMNFTPEVLVNQENREFRWVGKLMIKGIADGEHYFILEQIAPNQTKMTHGENFTGLLAGLLMLVMGEDTQSGFTSMNEALAKRVESN